MSFHNRTVWITGASSGIGAALAIELAGRGARCILSARTVARLEAVRNACPEPDRHLVLPLDTSDFEAHAPALAQAERIVGPIDILVMNAGIGQRGLALETDPVVMQRIMDVNFMANARLASLVAPSMAARGTGQLVVVSSVLGRIAIPGSSSYSASKFALHGYFEALRSELHPQGVAVTIVCPGYINTELTIHALQADGSTFGIIDHNHTYGMDADVCARKIARAVERKKPVLLVGGKETWGVHLGRFFPGLFRRLGRGYKRK